MPRETAEAFGVRLKYEFSGELISIVKAIRSRDRETAEEMRERAVLKFPAYKWIQEVIRTLPLDPPAETWTLEKKLNARLKELESGRPEPHISDSGQIGPAKTDKGESR